MKAKTAQDMNPGAEQPRGVCRRIHALRWGGAVAVSGAALLLLVGLLAPMERLDAAPRGAMEATMEPPISVESVVMEGDRATVKIKNQSPFLVIVHSGGVRVGWMRPHRVGIIRGLTTGYHKFFAHSQYGTVSWGPKEVWVPGPWNLVY